MKRMGFGTDGWRGVIADGYTMENLGIVTQAVMSYLKAEGGPKRLYIGYDTRFLSRESAMAAASVAAGNGFAAYVSHDAVTTPMLSHSVYINQCSGGLMVTASHNPFCYNGIKFKPRYGGSAYPEITSGIESYIGAEPVTMLPVDEARKTAMVTEYDPFPLYREGLYGMLDTDAIKRSGLLAVFDCMHGATGLYAARLWEGVGLGIDTLRAGPDPYFGGAPPEPVMDNLALLREEVASGGYAVGLAADGDGDRLGLVGPSGRFFGAHVVLSLLATHLCKNRGMSGAVAKSVSTSSLVDRVAEDLGLPVIETPVGFKHICKVMLTQDVMIGGEENGGVGVKGLMPERDGLLAALLVLEMLAKEGTDIDSLAEKLDERYGKLYYKRNDYKLSRGLDQDAFIRFSDTIGCIFGDFGISKISRLDGFKIVFRDGSWLLFRLSGTEPLVRVYAESSDPGRLERLMYRAKEALLG